MITANVRSSVLLSGTTPAGTDFSQGGDLTASVTVTVPPAAQSFSARAVVANNPGSSGYDLVAKLASAGSATIDGIALSAEEKVIASEAPYGVSQTHSVAVSGPDVVAIILTCRPR